MKPTCLSYFAQREEELKKTPFIIDVEKFPKRFSLLLTIPSFFAGLLGPAFVFNLVAKGIGVAGDNPGAIAGFMFGLSVLVPAYWISMWLLFWIMKRRQTRASSASADSPHRSR